jgi:c-di-GMP phosphodiesterase
MTSQGGQVIDIKTAQPESTSEMRYVARQPILDLKGRVHGYDLLFRNAPEAIFRRDAETAVETMLDNEVIFGLERLTNGLPSFITCTAEALTDNLVLVLPTEATILGIPAGVEPTQKVVDACRALKGRGFRLSLDDFDWINITHPLLNHADYIRGDFRLMDASMRQQLQQRAPKSAILVGQKVETQEDYAQACASGFTHFQGSYLCQPVLLKKRKVPANRMFHFEIVRELYRDPIDVRKVSQLVRRDASLTYRLLRLVNSPMYVLYQEVRSIETAIMILGETTFRRIMSVAVVSEMNGEQSAEILQMALVRARFCELAAGKSNQDAAEQYLLGMMSLLPAMLGVPMEEIIPNLPLRGPVCDALTGSMNAERSLLSWLECHERGDWSSCDAIVSANRLNAKALVQCYEEAVLWASSTPSAA